MNISEYSLLALKMSRPTYLNTQVSDLDFEIEFIA